MSQEDVWEAVACECPLKIITHLHRAGVYVHCTTARFPGKILCFHKNSELPADWEPTPAQALAWDQAEVTQPTVRQA